MRTGRLLLSKYDDNDTTVTASDGLSYDTRNEGKLLALSERSLMREQWRTQHTQ